MPSSDGFDVLSDVDLFDSDNEMEIDTRLEPHPRQQKDQSPQQQQQQGASLAVPVPAPWLNETDENDYCFICEEDFHHRDTAYTRSIKKLMSLYAEVGRRQLGRMIRDYYNDKVMENTPSARPWPVKSILEHIEEHDPTAAVVAKQDFRSQDRLRIALEQNGLIERDETTGMERPNVKQGNFYLKVLQCRVKSMERLRQAKNESED